MNGYTHGVDKGGGGGVRSLLMNVLVPVSAGGERIGELQYTSTDWNKLGASRQATVLVDICHGQNGACFEFDEPNEIIKLSNSEINPFNQLNTEAMKPLESLVNFFGNVHSVTTRSFRAKKLDNICMIRFLAHPKPGIPPAFPDDTVIGIIYSGQLAGILSEVIPTKSRPVNQ